MITDTQTLKTLTQLSSDLRSEYFKFDRHQDYPDQYPWEPSDAADFAHLLSLIQNYSPHQFTYKLGDPEFGRELIGYLNDIFGESSNTLNPEVIADYEKYKDEQRAKAEAEVVKKGFDPKTEAQKRINAIDQVAKNFQRAQQPEIAQKIADSAETISYQAVLSPEASITSTSQLGFTSTSTVAEVSMEMAPLATITYPYSENIESVFLQTTNFLPANIPDSSVTAIASAVTTLKYCATPTPLTNRDYESLIELVVKTEEAETGQRIDIPKESIASIANISPTQTPEQIFQTALKTELTKAGASGQVISGVFKAAPFLYAISSYTPTKPTDSKQEIAGKKSQVFGALAQVVLAQYGIIRPENLQNLSYAWIYSAAQSYYGPDQAFTSRFQNLSVSNPFDNQIVSFFKDQGIGKIKSYVTDTYIQPLATEAFSKFASSNLGQALGLGAKAAVTTGVETAAVGAGEVAAGAAAGTGLATTITGFLTALGIADPEPITKVIIAALALLSTQLKNIVSWLKKQSKNLILLLGGGIALLGGALGMALAGIVGLGIPGMVVGAGVGAVGFTALTGGSKALSAFASKATAFTGALVGLAAVEIGTTVIIIAISIPIVIALILFIINTSALVVPPNNLTASNSGTLGGGGACTIPSSGFCSPSYLSPTFGSQTNNAAQICNRESIGGNPAALNDSCLNYCGDGGDTSMVISSTNPSVSIRKCTWVSRNGAAYHTGDYSAGLFQTNLLCSSHQEPSNNGSLKECYRSFAVNYCGSLTCPNVSDWTLLANCVAYFWNPDNSIAYSNNQSSCNDTNPDTRNWTPWTTAKSCGIQSNCTP